MQGTTEHDRRKPGGDPDGGTYRDGDDLFAAAKPSPSFFDTRFDRPTGPAAPSDAAAAELEALVAEAERAVRGCHPDERAMFAVHLDWCRAVRRGHRAQVAGDQCEQRAAELDQTLAELDRERLLDDAADRGLMLLRLAVRRRPRQVAELVGGLLGPAHDAIRDDIISLAKAMPPAGGAW